jgi:hypothetical protein
MKITLAGIGFTINYPEDEVEANVSSEMTPEQLCEAICKVVNNDPNMTSFVVAAAVRRDD